MLSNEDFVRQSLELNLFFLRILKEHSIFLEAGFTPKNSNLTQQAEGFKNEFSRLLSETVSFSDSILSPDALTSGEIVTNLTFEAERVTEYFSGIPIDSELTRLELSLGRGTRQTSNPMLVDQVAALNQRILSSAGALADFKAKLLDDVLNCRVFTLNYPLLIDHILREVRFYIALLTRLQKRFVADIAKDAIEQEAFWNRIMAEHAKFIRGLLDPSENELFETANHFGKEFDELTRQAIALNDQVAQLPKVTKKSYKSAVAIRNFKKAGTEGILACKIRSTIVPLLADHVTREANHYLRLLKIYNARF